MFTKVLIGIDRRLGGRDPIALAKQLAGDGAEFTLAHVYPGGSSRLTGPPDDHRAGQREGALKLLQEARAQSRIQAELQQVESTSVGRGLHELAESLGADLLVVGSSHRGLAGRVLLRDDTHAALNGAPCPVAIAPGGYATEPHALARIGVAYNGSAESDHALAVARQLAAEHEASLSALEVVSLPTYAFLAGPAPFGNVLDDLVEAARERLRALPDVEADAVYGIAAQELGTYSGSVDLLVVGSRGYGPVGRLVHGSTSQLLARIARCPLLVLTRAARGAAAPGGDGDRRDTAESRTTA